jgi:hypothetical protein
MNVFHSTTGGCTRLLLWGLLLLPRVGAADVAVEPPLQPVYFMLSESKNFAQYRFYCDTGNGVLHLLADNKVYKIPVVNERMQPWTLVVYNAQDKTAFNWRQVSRHILPLGWPGVRLEVTGVRNNNVAYRESYLGLQDVPEAVRRGEGFAFLLRFPGDGNGPLQLGLLVASAAALTGLGLARRHHPRWLA